MTRRRSIVLVTVLVAVMVAEVAAGLWFDHLERQVDRPDLTGFEDGTWVLLIGVWAAMAVGAVIAISQPHHPVGWLFLALGVVIMAAGPIDGYAGYAVLGNPGSVPAGHAVALVADREWVPWLVLPALILQLTPDGHFLSPRWRRVAQVLVVSGVLVTVGGVLTDEPMNEPFDGLRSPLAVDALAPVLDVLQPIFVLVMGVCLVASAISLVVRFRRSTGDDRRQLLWLMFVVVPAPLFIALAFGGSMTDHDAVAILGTAGFVTLIPIAAGLSVLRYRLYDVERIVATTATWVGLSVLLVAVYAGVVWLGARAVPSGPVPPAVSATVGALAAVAVAAPARGWLQNALDRRFNRRAYDARRVIGAALAAEDAGIDVESVLREAVGDPGLTVTYPAPDGSWAGPPADPRRHVDVDRHGRVVARLVFDPDRTDAETVGRAAALAAADLDNTRLRAELVHQLDEVAASRMRLAGAQRRERRRIERDLHDGAQQSLLALAFELQSAQVNGDPDRMRAALAAGATSARDAVRELRELANGLHPAALADGGLSAALDDMARHSPVPLRLEVTPERLDPALEFTAWLVLGEAIVNAQKHAGARAIEVDVSRLNGHLLLRVADDGRGGANPDGPGVRGMRDRVETALGDLTVTSGTTGTTIEAVLPCGS